MTEDPGVTLIEVGFVLQIAPPDAQGRRAMGWYFDALDGNEYGRYVTSLHPGEDPLEKKDQVIADARLWIGRSLAENKEARRRGSDVYRENLKMRRRIKKAERQLQKALSASTED